MPNYKSFLRFAAAAVAWMTAPMAAIAQRNPGIRLLEPIGNQTSIPTDGREGLGVLGYYLSLMYPYVVGLGAAVAVMMGLVGGIQAMLAGGDDSKRSAGINRFLVSLGGLLFILLSAMILRVLNPSFFK